MVVTSAALGTYERLAQGRHSAMRQPAIEPVDCKVQRPNHYTTEPQVSLEFRET